MLWETENITHGVAYDLPLRPVWRGGPPVLAGGAVSRQHRRVGPHLLKIMWGWGCLAVRATPKGRSCEAQSEDGKKALVPLMPQSYPSIAKVAGLEDRLIRRYLRAKEELGSPEYLPHSNVVDVGHPAYTPWGALDTALRPCR